MKTLFEVVLAEYVNVVLKDFHTRHFSFSRLPLLQNPVKRKRDVGSSKGGGLEAPAWRTLLVELPTWSLSATASAKQLQ